MSKKLILLKPLTANSDENFPTKKQFKLYFGKDAVQLPKHSELKSALWWGCLQMELIIHTDKLFVFEFTKDLVASIETILNIHHLEVVKVLDIESKDVDSYIKSVEFVKRNYKSLGLSAIKSLKDQYENVLQGASFPAENCQTYNDIQSNLEKTINVINEASFLFDDAKELSKMKVRDFLEIDD